MSGQKRLYVPYFIYREVFVLNIAVAAVRDQLLTEKNNIIYKSLARLQPPTNRFAFTLKADILHFGKEATTRWTQGAEPAPGQSLVFWERTESRQWPL